jgi:hypothetical protein
MYTGRAMHRIKQARKPFAISLRRTQPEFCANRQNRSINREFGHVAVNAK